MIPNSVCFQSLKVLKCPHNCFIDLNMLTKSYYESSHALMWRYILLTSTREKRPMFAIAEPIRWTSDYRNKDSLLSKIHTLFLTLVILKVKWYFLIKKIKDWPVLTEIFCAIILPPMTARPVQRQCPTVPPTATP